MAMSANTETAPSLNANQKGCVSDATSKPVFVKHDEVIGGNTANTISFEDMYLAQLIKRDCWYSTNSKPVEDIYRQPCNPSEHYCNRAEH